MEESKWQEVKDFVFATYANEKRKVDAVYRHGYRVIASLTECGQQQKTFFLGWFDDFSMRAKQRKLSMAKKFRVELCGSGYGYWMFRLYPDDDNGIIANADDLLRHMSDNNVRLAQALLSKFTWDHNNNDVKLLLDAGFERRADWNDNVCYTKE